MNILVIHGSPRRGNSWDVLNIVKENLDKDIKITYKIVELSKVDLKICVGCYGCIFKGEDKCPHYIEMAPIVEELEMCDGLIMTTPVYSLQLSGILKNFIDHMSYNFHRPRYFTKKALIITTTAGAGDRSTAKYLKKVLEYWGINNITMMPVAYRSDVLTDTHKKYIESKANIFKNELTKTEHKAPTYKMVVMYNLWRAMSTAEYLKDTADYNYWINTDLVNVSYPKQVKVGIMKKAVGGMVYNIMKKTML